MECINEKPAPVNWVICNSPTSSLTKGKKYRVRGQFSYKNTYGSKGEKYQQWDTFIIIKNDYDYTVKVNLWRFKETTAPMTLLQMENKIEELETRLSNLTQ